MSEKLQKVLARVGRGSRRKVEQLIYEGRVSVNGVRAVLGDRVNTTDSIMLDGYLIKTKRSNKDHQFIVYNKVQGEICTRKDFKGRPTVFERLPKLCNKRWVLVGNMEINTSGLLVCTTDSELAHQLVQPFCKIDREYLVRVAGKITEDTLCALKKGMILDNTTVKFTDIITSRSRHINHWFYVCIVEGCDRTVRRLWESQGIKVNRLKCVRFGPIFLTSKTKSGAWIKMNAPETEDLYATLKR